MTSIVISIADISDFETEDLKEYSGCLNATEQAKVASYHFADDRKRSLMSILLQKYIIQNTWKLNQDEYDIQRSREV